MKAEFLTVLETRDLDEKNYCLTSPLVYRSILLGGKVTVPKGFLCDGSSVPRVPIAFLLYGGTQKKSGTLHDFFYRVPGHRIEIENEQTGKMSLLTVPKSLADSVFKEAMSSGGKYWWFPPFGLCFAGVVGGFRSGR